jgi:osmoprotectant transport system permease protein
VTVHGAIASLLSVCASLAPSAPPDHACPKLRVASKPFTEGYVLSEILAQIIEATGETSAERVDLAGPQLVFDALASGSVDLDVNYTGSIGNLLLKGTKDPSLEMLRSALAPKGIVLSEPLGFNNTYAIAVRTETAQKLHLTKVSDLRSHPELRGAFTPDFLNFEDGFYRLKEVYGIHIESVRPMQHSLAYRALANSEIDVTDAYTTDGSLAQFSLSLLEDDLHFFPKYYGVITARREVPELCPKTWAALIRLQGRISDAQMTSLNAQIEDKRASVPNCARAFLRQEHIVTDEEQSSTPRIIDHGLWTATLEHLFLVVVSLAISCLIGIPLGIVSFRNRRVGHAVIGVTGLLQTIPSLALLCFLIPFLGIGALPTIVALFIYGLLPIVQSTASGLLSLDPEIIETAKILGLEPAQRLRLVELPLASINIIGGIKTTAVINVATATIAALIGAGGYGRYITSGLAMNDMATVFKGAVPTAIMALAFHGLFELLGMIMRPR